MQHVYGEDLKVDHKPTPQPTPGSAVIRVEVAPVVSYMRDIYNGTRRHPYPTPLVTGAFAIGRVAAIGPDATLLQPGLLVLVDCVIHGRDDPQAIMLSGIMDGMSEGGKKLMSGEWRDSTYAEYVKAPLENCHVINEHRMFGSIPSGGLGYSIDQLAWLPLALVGFGGLRSLNLQPGQTIIISPATGGYGGAAAIVALAMGARVIAVGRNQDALNRLKAVSNRIETVQITGDVDKEASELKKFGTIDAFLDITPPAAQHSTHFKSCIQSLKTEGRVAFMSGLLQDLSIPLPFIVRNNITLAGKWMYAREDVQALLSLLELGLLNLDHVELKGKYSLEDWETAFETAFSNTKLGDFTLLSP